MSDKKSYFFCEKFQSGSVGANCYVSYSGNTFVVIDPGFCSDKITNFINSNSSDPSLKILLTHGHADNIGGLNDIIKEFEGKCKIYCNKKDIDFFYDSNINLSKIMGVEIDLSCVAYHLINVASGDEINAGDLHFRVIETPGHTPGSIIFILDKERCVFTGDTLLKGLVGPTSLPYGDPNMLFVSLRDKVLALHDDFVVYPGHGEDTTIEEEKKNNPYIRSICAEGKNH